MGLHRRDFLFASAALAAGGVSAADAPAGYWAYFGTYTGGKSKGIYRSRFDPKGGSLSAPELAAEVTSPSFLAVAPNGKFLYAVGETAGAGGKKGGGVFAFKLNPKTGELTKTDETDSGGPGPCHLSIDRAGCNLGVANYGGGSTLLVSLSAGAKFSTQRSFVQHKGGSGVNKGRQAGPHAHSFNFSQGDKFAVVADLGLDQLLVYKHDAEAVTLTPNDPPAHATPPGSGPRHFAFHPNGRFAYACGELDFTCIALTFDTDKGVFRTVNTATTLPKDTPEAVRKKNSTAEVCVHPSGQWVLVSNRGHNSLAVFRVNPETGAVTPAGHVTGDISIPRNFAFDPTGRWILVCNQDGETVNVFAWDNDAGTGAPTGAKVEVGKPVCVRFVPAA